MRYSIHSFLIASCILSPSLARAQWQPNGTIVCGIAGYQANPSIVSDDAGGAIVVWEDWRNGSPSLDVYAQRVNGSGVALWSAGGVPICVASKDQVHPVIVSDGAGGAIVAWEDQRALFQQIFAQHVDASGTTTWPDSGIAVSTITSNKGWPRLASDGAAGAIISWLDLRAGNLDVYAQRVNASGGLQWTPGGVPVCTAANHQQTPDLISDGNGGAIFGWMDGRVGPGNDIYVQRVDALGAPQWTADGVGLCTVAGNENLPQLAPDGAGGAIVAWYDSRAGSTPFDIYAARIDAAGAPQWTANGVAICTAANNQDLARIISDGAGGAIITWEDFRVSGADIYAQRVNGAGVTQWAANGVALTLATNHQTEPRIVSDGAGGAVVAWDHAVPNDHDIYAQRVDASGVIQWAPNGEAISSTSGAEQSRPVIAPDGSGGAIMAWKSYDYFTGESDIYALRHPLPPTPVGRPPAMTSLRILPNYPNPFNASTTFDVYLPVESGFVIDVYDVAGRRVRGLSLANRRAGWRQFDFDGRDDAGRLLPSGIYFLKASAAGKTATRKMVVAR